MKLIRRNEYTWTGWEFTFDPVRAILWAVIWSMAAFYGAFVLGCVLYWLGWWR